MRREPGFEHALLVLPSLLHPRPGSQRGQKSEPMGCQAWALPHRNALPLAGPCAGARCCYDSLDRRCAEMPGGGSPLLSRGFPFNSRDLYWDLKRKAERAPAGTITPLTTPTTSLPQPLLPFCAWPHPVTTQAPADSQAHITTQSSAGLCVTYESLQVCALEALPPAEDCKPLLRAHGYSLRYPNSTTGCGGFWETGKQS